LMNDRQTIGGYPRLGALTPSACAALAQCLPGTEVWLMPVSASHAQADYRRQHAQWATA
ncbi:MAG: Allophanate hydrolase subunit 2, partial [Halomonas sp. HL-93]